jgi:molybdopterin/thiamine biosynthesis adenylyltransferase
MSPNKIGIGGNVFGIAADIDDPSGRTWALLQAMTGALTADEIVAQVAAQYPADDPASIRADLHELFRAGYAKDVDAPDPPGLTIRDKTRHDRARILYEWMTMAPRASAWEFLADLKRARVTVIGLGGTGSEAAKVLAAGGVGHVNCIDPDSIRLSNLNRQTSLYSESDIGRAKVIAGCERLSDCNRDITVTGSQSLVTGVEDLRELAATCDVLLLAADEPPALRSWTNQACIDEKRPWVDAGYHGPLITVGAYIPGQGACWQCVTDTGDEYRVKALGVDPAEVTARRKTSYQAASSVTATLSGGLGAWYVMVLITDVPPLTASEVTYLNLMSLGATYTASDPARPGCSACSPSKAPAG